MKELLILLFLVLIFCIKLLRKNNENFESSSASTSTSAPTSTDSETVIANPFIIEASKNSPQADPRQITLKYYQDNPNMKSCPTICEQKSTELKKLPPDWHCYLDREEGNCYSDIEEHKSYLYNMYLGKKKYIYHIDNDLKKIFDDKYKVHLESNYDGELNAIIGRLDDRIRDENTDKDLLMYHILFDKNLMHRILNIYSEYPAKLSNNTSINNHVSLKTLLSKPQNTSIRDIPKSDLIKLIMDNLYKSYREAEAILAINTDPIKACLKLIENDTKCFIDFLSEQENMELSKTTINSLDQIYKSTQGKEYNIIMDDYV